MVFIINEPASGVIEGYIQAAHPPMQKDYKKARRGFPQSKY